MGREVVAQLEKDVGKVVSVKIGYAGNAKFRKMLNAGGSYAGGGGAPVYTFITDVNEDVVGKITPIGIQTSSCHIDIECGNNYTVTDSHCKDLRNIVDGYNSDIMKLWEARNK